MSGAGGTHRARQGRSQERAASETSAAHDEARWRTEIALLLGSRCFPARLADLASHLAQVQAPSRLLWRLSGVNPDIRFTSLDALIADIDSHAKAAPLRYREPM